MMKLLPAVAVLATSFGLITGQQEIDQREAVWLTDFEAAKTAAKENNKVILADFTGSDWCGWCIKLKDEVFVKPEFAEWANENVVLLELDFPRKVELDPKLVAQNKELASKYGIEGYPTILFIDAEGEEVGRTGYVKGGPEAWIAEADSKIGSASLEWTTDYKAALKRAKKQKKLILADFTGSDWCGWCIKLKNEVFSKPEFAAWAEENVVLLELDFPRKTELDKALKKQNDKLQRKFKINGFPTIVMIDKKGKQVGKLGYVEGGPEAWIAAAEKQMGKYAKKRKKKKGSKSE